MDLKNEPGFALSEPAEKKISWAEAELTGLSLEEARRRVRERAKRALMNRGDWRAVSIPAVALPTDQLIGVFDARCDWDEPASFQLPPDLYTAYPCIDGDNMLYRLASLSELVGETLKEPSKHAHVVQPKLLLIPALMADRQGRRIGRGRGFYDRYLTANPDVTALVVVHSDYVFDRLPEAWLHAGDRPVQGLLTESQFFDFGNLRSNPT